jgi:hypothetical protein
VELSEEYPTGTSFMGIRLLGTLALSNASVNGIRLSGLAWDEDEQTLYAPENSALVDMAALPDGSLLTLERAYASPFQPLIISLRRVWLLAWPGTDPPPKVEEVAVLDSGQALIHHQTPKKNLVGPEQSGR